jgi:segregation and condensation protein A
VNFQIAEHQTEGYRINTPVYEGPLDLLLDLIERAELDITKLALAQVTDQFLAYLHHLPTTDPAEVSAFLVIASRLVLIKSAALLPHPPVIEIAEDEEQSGEALAQQLIQYRRFRQLAAWLAAREAAGLRTYLRLTVPAPRLENHLDMSNLTIDDLVRIAFQIFIGNDDLPALSNVVSLPRITVREKIESILQIINRKGSANFRSLSGDHSKLEIVITFLAILELIKQSILQAEQDNLFSEINLLPADAFSKTISDAVDLEFGE